MQRLSKWKPRYFDIGVNFSDGMFHGMYNGLTSKKHPTDVTKVIARAKHFGVQRMLVTASSIAESAEHFELVQAQEGLFSTVGVHPCSVAEEFYGGLENELVLPDFEDKLAKLRQLTESGVENGFVKAFGEIGLDYDRLHYSSVTQQRASFKAQLEVIASLKHLLLPLFLHMRSACDDFVELIEPYIEAGSIQRGNGVVHSFTGTEEELQKILKLGFHIGVNGCSLKTEKNLKVALKIPRLMLMIETDAPWCEIRKSHASYRFLTPYPNLFYPAVPGENIVATSKKSEIKLDALLPFPSIKKENHAKHTAIVQNKLENSNGELNQQVTGELASPLIKSRNEPVNVGHVAQIMATLLGIEGESDTQAFVDEVYQNSCRLFKII